MNEKKSKSERRSKSYIECGQLNFLRTSFAALFVCYLTSREWFSHISQQMHQVYRRDQSISIQIMHCEISQYLRFETGPSHWTIIEHYRMECRKIDRSTTIAIIRVNQGANEFFCQIPSKPSQNSPQIIGTNE